MLAKWAGWLVEGDDEGGEHGYENCRVCDALCLANDPRKSVVYLIDLFWSVGVFKEGSDGLVGWEEELGAKTGDDEGYDEGEVMKRFCGIVCVFNP